MEQPRSSGQAVNYLFFAETINSHFPECEKLKTYKMSINNSHFHFPECEKLRTNNNANQQLELLSLFQHWSWSESLELWKPTGETQFPSNICIKMCHNASSTKISCQGWRWARWRQPWVWRRGHRPVHCRGEADLDLYIIMMKCLSVTKMITSELSTRGAKRNPC